MGKRSGGPSSTNAYKRPHKTAKRLAIKQEMLAAKKTKK